MGMKVYFFGLNKLGEDSFMHPDPTDLYHTVFENKVWQIASERCSSLYKVSQEDTEGER